MGILVISTDDARARRYIGDMLALAGGTLPVSKVREEYKRAFNCEPLIYSDDEIAALPPIDGFPIDNSMVRLPEEMSE